MTIYNITRGELFVKWKKKQFNKLLRLSGKKHTFEYNVVFEVVWAQLNKCLCPYVYVCVNIVWKQTAENQFYRMTDRLNWQFVGCL